MLKKLYIIRREDISVALSKGFLSHGCFPYIGSLWAYVSFTDEERKAYPFPIWENIC